MAKLNKYKTFPLYSISNIFHLDNSSAALVYAWYSSCLNETQRKESGDKPLLELILQYGSCPIISPSTWTPYGWSFADHMVQLNRISIHPFFVMLPRNDLVNSSRVLLTVRNSYVFAWYSISLFYVTIFVVMGI